MNNAVMITIAIFFPILCGIGLLLAPEFKKRNVLTFLTGMVLVLTAALSFLIIFGGEKELVLLSLGENMEILFRIDNVGRLFALVVTVVWLLAGFYAFEYMKHEKEEKRYFGFYLMVFGVLLALDFAGNMITYYLFYEILTL